MIISVKYASATTYQITYDNGMKTSCSQRNREYAEIEAWVEDGNTIDPQFTAQEMLDNTAAELVAVVRKLHAESTGYVAEFFDALGSARINMWYAHADTPAAAKTKITNCITWIDTVMLDYYTRKTQADPSFDFSNNGNPPYTFAELKTACEA